MAMLEGRSACLVEDTQFRQHKLALVMVSLRYMPLLRA